LSERFDDFSTKINKSYKGFRLNFERKKIFVKESAAVESTFDILVTGKGGEYSLNLTHVQP
jgi:hypothetical protein